METIAKEVVLGHYVVRYDPAATTLSVHLDQDNVGSGVEAGVCNVWGQTSWLPNTCRIELKVQSIRSRLPTPLVTVETEDPTVVKTRVTIGGTYNLR